MRTAELIGPALDWAVAKCEGKALREPVNAAYADVAKMKVPFYLREVVCTYQNDVCVRAEVKDIKVTRCGIDATVGATSPSISFTGSDGRLARGSVDMFFISTEEAELEALSYLKGGTENFSPSTDWAQGGPIIEREKLDIKSPRPNWQKYTAYIPQWRQGCGVSETFAQYGPTPLIAAMRCYVLSVQGDTIDIPEELL